MLTRGWSSTPQSTSVETTVSKLASEAVIRVLAAADGPLRAREIHAAAQQLAGTPLESHSLVHGV